MVQHFDTQDFPCEHQPRGTTAFNPKTLLRYHVGFHLLFRGAIALILTHDAFSYSGWDRRSPSSLQQQSPYGCHSVDIIKQGCCYQSKSALQQYGEVRYRFHLQRVRNSGPSQALVSLSNFSRRMLARGSMTSYEIKAASKDIVARVSVFARSQASLIVRCSGSLPLTGLPYDKFCAAQTLMALEGYLNHPCRWRFTSLSMCSNKALIYATDAILWNQVPTSGPTYVRTHKGKAGTHG